MVVPNIGAFIAWGLITALFIPTGWAPNETYVKLVGPMILNLLPILIGYTGGSVIYGHRGGVIGAVATMGVVVGSSIPQFLGGMIMGPSAAWVLKKVDGVLQPRVPVGFELLVNNFALGIPHCAISLALCERGEPVYGIIYDLSRRTLMHGGPGFGAFDGERGLSVSTAPISRETLVGFHSPFDKTLLPMAVPTLFVGLLASHSYLLARSVARWIAGKRLTYRQVAQPLCVC